MKCKTIMMMNLTIFRTNKRKQRTKINKRIILLIHFGTPIKNLLKTVLKLNYLRDYITKNVDY